MGPMVDATAVQCPICGWTGAQTDLEVGTDGTACPTCGESIDV